MNRSPDSFDRPVPYLAPALPGRCLISFCAMVMFWFAPNAHAVGTYLLNEKFNDMTTNAAPTNGWTSFAASGSVQVRELPFAQDKSVRIEKTNSTTNASGISRTFPNYTGKVAFEAKVLMRESVPFHVCPYIYDGNGNAVISVGFENGNIISYVGSTKTTIQPFSINDWYMIRVVINTAANTYDLFIDGVRKLNNAAVRNSATSGLAQLKFYMDGSNVGTFYVDNVKIWEMGDFVGAAAHTDFRCP